jgi:hypothetical protein
MLPIYDRGGQIFELGNRPILFESFPNFYPCNLKRLTVYGKAGAVGLGGEMTDSSSTGSTGAEKCKSS